MSMQILVLGNLKHKPYHPYEIKQKLLQNKWDKLISVTDGNLYQAIRTLSKNSYIEEVKQEQKNNRPSRTVYRITNEGEKYLEESILDVFKKMKTDKRSLYPALLFIDHANLSEALSHIENWINKLDSELHETNDHELGIHQLIQIHYDGSRSFQRDWLKKVHSTLSKNV